MLLVTPGLRLNDRFVLVEQVGTGGMSQVWRASDELLGRPVAVKMLAAEIAADPGLQETTWREARAAARLTHPNVTRVYDCGEAPVPGGGRMAFLVMELVEGESLAHRLAAAGPLPWPEVAWIGAQVAAALAAAHELGVVHHDVKPGNVMLTTGGAKVLDFGTAALIGALDHDALVGTPGYTAPERLEWAPAQPASDLYSLGVLLTEAVTGAPPATPAPPAPTALPDPATLPPAAEELLRACLAPEPGQRPTARRAAALLAGLAGVPDPAASVLAEPPTVAGNVLTDPPTVAAPLPGSVPRAVSGPGAVPVSRAGAVGRAAPPGPPTRVDHRWPEPQPAGRGGRRLMLAGIAVAVVVLGLVLILAVAAPRDAPPSTAGPGPAGGSGSPAPTGPPTTAGPPPADLTAALAGIDQAIGDARTAGTIDQDAAQKLQDKLRDLVKELEKPNESSQRRTEKIREKAEQLREEIEKLRDEGEVPPALAAELQRLTAPLA